VGVTLFFFFFLLPPSLFSPRLRSALDGLSAFFALGVHSMKDLFPALLSRAMFSSHTEGFTAASRLRSALDGRPARRFAVVGRWGPGSSWATDFLSGFFFFLGLPFLKMSLSRFFSAFFKEVVSFVMSESHTEGLTFSERFFPAEPGRS